MTHRANPLTVVVAAYNEEAALPRAASRASPPCSTGSTLRRARALRRRRQPRRHLGRARSASPRSDPRVALLRLSRNFGKELALTAGLDLVDADAVVVIDADGQDPPELHPGLRRALARRRTTSSTARAARATARAGSSEPPRAPFYRVHRTACRDTGIPRRHRRFPPDVAARARGAARTARTPALHEGPVRLGRLSAGRAAVRARSRASPARSKFNYWRLWNFALEGITGFSTAPLRVGDLPRPGHRAAGLRLRRVDRGQDPALGRPGAGLADA